MQYTPDTVEQLAEANRRKDEFLAVLSHELRNPLASVSSAVNVLRNQNVRPAERRRMLGIIERQANQLRHLTDELLELSRIASGRIHLNRDHIDLRSVARQALETTAPIVEGHAHRLTVVMPQAPAMVYADAVRLRQVLINLLDNAAKYTEDGGELSLSIYPDGEQILVRVRDNGIGIDEQALPHIFELYAQADRSVAQAQGGLGVGLALVRKLVELHGGSVSCVSGGPGQGSEFIVCLPASVAYRPMGDRAARPSAPREARAPPGYSEVGDRVLS